MGSLAKRRHVTRSMNRLSLAAIVLLACVSWTADANVIDNEIKPHSLGKTASICTDSSQPDRAGTYSCAANAAEKDWSVSSKWKGNTDLQNVLVQCADIMQFTKKHVHKYDSYVMFGLTKESPPSMFQSYLHHKELKLRCPLPAAEEEEELQLPRGVDALTAESLAHPARGVDALTADSLATPVSRGVDALVEALLSPEYAESESEKHPDSKKINTEIIVPESESDQDLVR